MNSQVATILVVEDNATLRSLILEILGNADYTLLEAPDGESALQIAAKHPEVDLVITDGRMPGISGLRLARHIIDTRPRVKILLISGDSEARNLRGQSFPLLLKPFTPEELRAAVHRLLRPT